MVFNEISAESAKLMLGLQAGLLAIGVAVLVASIPFAMHISNQITEVRERTARFPEIARTVDTNTVILSGMRQELSRATAHALAGDITDDRWRKQDQRVWALDLDRKNPALDVPEVK